MNGGDSGVRIGCSGLVEPIAYENLSTRNLTSLWGK